VDVWRERHREVEENDAGGRQGASWPSEQPVSGDAATSRLQADDVEFDVSIYNADRLETSRVPT